MRISDWSSDVCSSDLVNACDPAFRPMVQAALLTGARYAELAALEVRDYDPTSRTVWLRDTNAGNARVVYLEEEGKIGRASWRERVCQTVRYRWTRCN